MVSTANGMLEIEASVIQEIIVEEVSRLTPGDNKVEEPLGSSSEGHIEGTEASGGDFGNETPAHGTPSKLEETFWLLDKSAPIILG